MKYITLLIFIFSCTQRTETVQFDEQQFLAHQEQLSIHQFSSIGVGGGVCGHEMLAGKSQAEIKKIINQVEDGVTPLIAYLTSETNEISESYLKALEDCYLKNEADPNLAALGGRVPLSYAISMDKEVVRLLLQYGANANYQYPNTGNTLLHEIVMSTKCELIPIFLQKGADPSLVDQFAHTPLDLAKQNASLLSECVQYLEKASEN